MQTSLNLLNETLAAAIVIIAASMLLYNLSRNLNDRIAKTSGIVLGCVTVAYISDVLVSLDPTPSLAESFLRLQWIGLAYIPAATMHLSDALLATTGLPSRGRRRRVVRILYLIGTVFLLCAAFTDILIDPLTLPDDRVSTRAGPLFPIYVLYFLIVNGVAFINVDRARRRCQTRTTKRRMAYLQSAMLTPAIGIFPYSVLLGAGQEFSLVALVLVNIANFVVVLMLLFLAFPLSFFGSHVPDRVVKRELLRFILRGPGTSLLALFVIIFTDPTTSTLGLPGDMFIPFATVAVILLWQWMIDLTLPWLEKRLIYPDEDDEQAEKLQRLSERYLSKGDLLQLTGAALEAICDYLRVDRAYILSLSDDNEHEIVKSIGTIDAPSAEEIDDLEEEFTDANDTKGIHWQEWHSFWMIPLYSQRIIAAEDNLRKPLIGIMGVQSRADALDETELNMLERTVHRTAQTLDDLILQEEIYAALEGLLPQIAITRAEAAEVEYRPGRNPRKIQIKLPDREQVIEQVHAALRHYWGGPGLTRSRLMELNIVQQKAQTMDNNPVNALRDVLKEHIDMLRPEGEQDMRSQEWTLYNILTLRFIESKKARETARRLYLGEATLYRKQNVAIATVADSILQAERDALSHQPEPSV